MSTGRRDTPERSRAGSGTRAARERHGRRSEWLAALALMARGYRILERRHKTPLGEIDLIARRGKRLAFVEVKARRTLEDCHAAITPRAAARIRRAATLWLGRKPQYHGHDQGFDVVFVLPRRWPRHIEDGL